MTCVFVQTMYIHVHTGIHTKKNIHTHTHNALVRIRSNQYCNKIKFKSVERVRFWTQEERGREGGGRRRGRGGRDEECLPMPQIQRDGILVALSGSEGWPAS